MGKKILWAVISLLCVAGVGLAVFLTKKPPSPGQEDGEKVASYVASEQFGSLPTEEKEAYLKKTWENREGKNWQETYENLDEEKKDQLRENLGEMFRERMRQRVEEYFELPQEEREAFLDEMIDRMQQHRRQWEDRRGPGRGRDGDRERRDGETGRNGPGPGGRGFTPDRMKSMLENTSPEDRAKFVEFHKDLRERLRERGLGRGR